MTTTFSEAVEFYLIHAESRQLSQRTLQDYTNTYAKFAFYIGADDADDLPTNINAKSILKWLNTTRGIRSLTRHTTMVNLWHYCVDRNIIDDPDINTIDRKTIEAFLANFRGVLRKKSILNYHIGLRALWRWAHEEEALVDDNVAAKVTSPKTDEIVIKPYTKEEIRLLLEACHYNKEYGRPNQRSTVNRRQTTHRDRAIILTLLDTGVRNGELRDFNINDCDMRERRLLVRQAKGNKERYVYFSARTALAIQRYLNSREDKRKKNNPLFTTRNQTRLSSQGLLQLVQNAGKREGVQDVTVHRFRHTFAIESVRNGLNAFVLQKLLGHSSIDMVKRYLTIAETDLAEGHYHASPVDTWRL